MRLYRKHSAGYHSLQTFQAQYYFAVLDSMAGVIADSPV